MHVPLRSTGPIGPVCDDDNPATWKIVERGASTALEEGEDLGVCAGDVHGSKAWRRLKAGEAHELSSDRFPSRVRGRRIDHIQPR